MFECIKINNFRGIRFAEIREMKYVNLFWGKNNCGKSTLLDSLFLISGLSNPQLPLTINFLRDYLRISEKDLSLNFYNFDISNNIKISAENKHVRDLQISLIATSNIGVDIESSNLGASNNILQKEFGYRLDYSYDASPHYSELIFKSQDTNAIQRTDDKYNESLICKYITPKFKFAASDNALKEMFENKDEHFLLDALRIISPDIVDLQLAEDAILVDIGVEQRIPINLMGDGIRKILAIVVGIYECRNGILLIDEIDNGLHYSVLEKVWEVIVRSAKANNTQVFATTHSIDSLKGFNQAIKIADCGDDVSAFKLLHLPGGELKAFPYLHNQLDYAIEQEIEIR